MSNRAHNRKLLSISEVSDPAFRLDCLLLRVGNALLSVAEEKVKLPGLREAIAPIMEDEIKKHVTPDKIVSKKYEKLARMAGKHFGVA